MSMSLQCPRGQEGQWYPGVHQEESGQQVEGGDPDPLLDPNEATSGVLCSILISIVKERQGANREGPAGQCKDGLRSGASLY